MSTLTLHLTPGDETRVDLIARLFGLDPEQAILLAVAHAAEVAPRTPSAAELAGDLIGHFDGPEDLSTNPAYLNGLGSRL